MKLHIDQNFFAFWQNSWYNFLVPKCPETAGPGFVYTLRPDCVDSSCKLYISWEHLNILTQKITREGLI